MAVKPSNDQAPVWARSDVFPLKPSVSSDSGAFFAYGYIDGRGNQVGVESIDELVAKVGECDEGIDLVWSPDSEYLVAPEQVPELRQVLWQRRRKWALRDVEDGKRMSLVFAAITLWLVYAGYRNTGGNLMLALRGARVGIAAIFLLMFGLIPLYEGWKTLRKGEPHSEEEWLDEAAESRFDSWLARQKTPLTTALLVVMVITGLTQLWLERGLDWSARSVMKAGLLKTPGSEAWRYLTAPFVHGNLLHWLMNAAALKYIARRVESLARWPHVLIVLVISAFVGGLATAAFTSAPSVGASGGIMGLLGFLLVFETLHSGLVPKPSRRRLLAGVIFTVLMGLFGFQFIDNAAHAGGLLAGMAYAWLVFPASKSVHRPTILGKDRIVAGVAAAVIVLGLLVTLLKLTH